MALTQAMAGGLAALALCTAAGAQTWTVGPTEVPPPAGASEALRTSIATQPQPEASALPALPATRQAWIDQVIDRDRMRAEVIDATLATAPVDVREDRIAAVTVYRVSPRQSAERFADTVFMELHGGAYVYGNGKAGLTEAIVIAERLGIDVIAVDYRMPPLDEAFPAAVDDAVSVYLELIKTRDPASIAVGGTSAGGGLTLALVHRLKEIGAPLPGALYAGTPWADLTKTGDTLYTNEGLDRVLVKYEGGLQSAAALYVGVNDWKDPLISPVYGDFSGFPPTILTSGTRDLFLSDVVRTHRKLRAAGVDADLHVYEAISHAGYFIWAETPESRDMYNELAAFLDRHLSR